MYIYIYIHMYMYIYIHMYMYIYIYIHVHKTHESFGGRRFSDQIATPCFFLIDDQILGKPTTPCGQAMCKAQARWDEIAVPLCPHELKVTLVMA